MRIDHENDNTHLLYVRFQGLLSVVRSLPKRMRNVLDNVPQSYIFSQFAVGFRCVYSSSAD